MSQLRKCPKDNIEVDEEFFCSRCVFWIRDPFKGMYFANCEYNQWNPGMKTGKDTSNDIKS